MKKYLGSKITAYVALVAPVISVVLPALFGLYALYSEISGATLFTAVLCFGCSIFMGIYLKSVSNQLYSWGVFQSEGIDVTTVFSKPITIRYDQCKSCGIGYYTHGFTNSNIGIKVYFLFFSYDGFNEKYRTQINLWKPSQNGIKVEFNKKLYKYLLSVLPEEQSSSLQRDYDRFFSSGVQK